MEWMYLPDDKNDESPSGNEKRLCSRKVDPLMEKCCIPWVCILCMSKEPQIALIKFGESLQ